MSLINAVVIYLMYIGARAFKEDNICKTGTVWHGFGDVQPVDKKFLPMFLKHPDVWRQVDSPDAKPERIEQLTGGQVGGDDAPKENDEGLNSLGDSGSSAKQNESDAGDQGKPDDENKDGGDAEDLTEIKAAIMALELGNPEHFSAATGVPMINAVRAAAGNPEIKTKQVNAAWAAIKAASASN